MGKYDNSWENYGKVVPPRVLFVGLQPRKTMVISSP